MRRGNDDCIHEAGTDQLLAIRKDFERLVTFELSRYGVGHGDEFRAANLPGRQVAVVMLADVPHANDAKSNFAHGIRLRDALWIFQPSVSKARNVKRDA